jgi:hypothetical protein
MILLEPANTITHLDVEIKRRTISLTGFLTNFGVLDSVSMNLVKTRLSGNFVEASGDPLIHARL